MSDFSIPLLRTKKNENAGRLHHRMRKVHENVMMFSSGNILIIIRVKVRIHRAVLCGSYEASLEEHVLQKS